MNWQQGGDRLNVFEHYDKPSGSIQTGNIMSS
jgi:hypothetical protein